MTRKAASFVGLRPASESSSRVKRNNRRDGTQHELILRRELKQVGLKFRANVKSLPGKPDIVFDRARVVVFCDGDFWHGRNWRSLRRHLAQGTNAGYWLAKIANNAKRDKANTVLLENNGWRVIRLWETDTNRDPAGAARLVKSVVDCRLRRLARGDEDKRKGRK